MNLGITDIGIDNIFKGLLHDLEEWVLFIIHQPTNINQKPIVMSIKASFNKN